MANIEEIRSVKASVETELLRRPGVTGIGIGVRYVAGERTTELALVVFVTEKKRQLAPDELIPPIIRGIRTDVREATFRPCGDTKRYDPLVGGISVRTVVVEAGHSSAVR